MSALAAAGRRIRLRRRSAWVSRRRVRLLLIAATITALAATGGWFLFRDSSFVAVEHVTVMGTEGPDAAAITAALDSAARKMTTLDFQIAPLRQAVARFQEVRGMRVSTNFPHGMVILVSELLPVAVIRAPGQEMVVDGDGALLPNVRVTGSLPVMTLTVPPVGGSLDQPWALAAARLLAPAPRRLLPRLSTIMMVAGHGLVAQVRNGPSIYFDDASQAQAKWTAAVAVLADPASAGASYIDVTDPARPAAGTNAQMAQSTTTSAAGATAGATTSPTTTTPVTSATPTTTTPVTSATPTAASTTTPVTSATPAATTPAATTTPTGG